MNELEQIEEQLSEKAKNVLIRTCKRCKYHWIRRVFSKEPSICPKCNNPYWNKERKVKNAGAINDGSESSLDGNEVVTEKPVEQKDGPTGSATPSDVVSEVKT